MPEETTPIVSVQDWTSLSVTLGGLLEGQRNQNEQLNRIELKVDAHANDITGLKAKDAARDQWQKGIEEKIDRLTPERGRMWSILGGASALVATVGGVTSWLHH